MQSERLALLQGYSKEAFKRANNLLVLALSVSCILPLIILPACFVAHLQWQAYLPVSSTLYGIVHLLWKAYFTAIEWAETCARKVQAYVLPESLLSDRQSRRGPVRGLVAHFLDHSRSDPGGLQQR